MYSNTHSIRTDFIRLDIWQNLHNNDIAHVLSQHSCMAVTGHTENGRWMDATEMRMLNHINGISYEDHVENTAIRRQERVKEMSSYISKRRQTCSCLPERWGWRYPPGHNPAAVERYCEVWHEPLGFWSGDLHDRVRWHIGLLSFVLAKRLPAKDAARWERWEKTWSTNYYQMYYEPWFKLNPSLKQVI